MSSIGFTGTRKGMTEIQRITAINLLHNLKPSIFHHGDCIGGDAQMHEAADIRNITIHVYPPTNNRFRAFCKPTNGWIRKPKPYLKRNEDIVDSIEILIAAPFDRSEQGGTWSTAKLAFNRNKVVFLVFPDGSIEREKRIGGLL